MHRLAIIPILALAASAEGKTSVIAITGQAAPDGNGLYSTFQSPVLNDIGQAAFISVLNGTSGGATDIRGIFRGDETGAPLVQIVRGGQNVPGGNGKFLGFMGTALNNSGQVAFQSNLTSTSGGQNVDDSGVYRADGTIAGLFQLARAAQPPPDNNGVFGSFTTSAINTAGQATWLSVLVNTNFGSADQVGLYRSDGSTLTQFARARGLAPGGNGRFAGFNQAALNDTGHSAFLASLTGTSGGTADDSGIFRASSTSSTLLTVAREGQTIPGGNGAFASFTSPAIGDTGQATFVADLSSTPGGTTDNAGVFRGDGTVAGLAQLARKGQSAPGGGNFSAFSLIAANDVGQAVFRADLTNTANNAGLFRSNSDATLAPIIRKGALVAGNNGVLSTFTSLAFNDAGQTAFLATLANTAGGTTDDTGIFLYDDTFGLLTIAREGSPFLGSTITSLGFSTSSAANGEERSSLNDIGQVAYQFTLLDGRQGIAIWTVPEPTALSLLAISALAMRRRAR